MLNELQKDFLPKLEQAWKDLVRSALSNSPMVEMLEYHRLTGGKRLRAMTVLLAAEPFLRRNGKSWKSEVERLLPLALAVELIHNATLIHDDIQDGDTLRRGKETLWKKYSLAQGINCGDALFFLAFRALELGKYPADLAVFFAKELESSTLTVIEGQSREFSLKEKLKTSKNFLAEEYEQMVRGKTAALFSLPYVCGAKIAGANDSEISDWRMRAEKIGIAFQIQDDVLDLWGNKGRDVSGSDIAEGKISYPVLQSLKILTDANRDQEVKWLVALLLKEREATASEDIAKAIRLMDDCGARANCIAEVSKNLKEATDGGMAAISFAPIAELLQKIVSGQE